MSNINPSSLKVVELRAELSRRGLPQKGKKDELIARLTEAIEAESKDNANDQPEQPEQPEKSESLEAKSDEKDTVMDEAPTKEEETAPQTDADKEELESTPSANDKKVAESQGVEKEEEANTATIEDATKALVESDKDAPAVQKAQKGKAATATTEKEAAKSNKEQTVGVSSSSATDAKSANSNKRKASPDVENNAEDVKRTKTDKRMEITTSAIYVKGFVRPLILSHVEDLFKQFGKVTRLWMDTIKTHCYVVYEHSHEASRAANYVDGLIFPKETGKELTVGELTPEQAAKLIEYEKRAEHERKKVDWEEWIRKVTAGEELTDANGSPGDAPRRLRPTGIDLVARELHKAAGDSVNTALSPTSSVPANSSGRLVRVVEQEQVEPAKKELSLDDLFRKTKTTPQLYYLPNTDEEARIKLEQLRQVA